MPHVSAILTAAGESTRMGRPKALLPWRGAPLVEYQAASLLAGGASEVVVVLGHEHEAVAQHVEGESVRYVVNPTLSAGKDDLDQGGAQRAGGRSH